MVSCIVGWGVAMGVALAGSALSGPRHCRDGWASTSIGRQGACSHHGGVSGAGEFLGIVAIVGGAMAGFRFYESAWGERLGAANRPMQRGSPQTPEPTIRPSPPPRIRPGVSEAGLSPSEPPAGRPRPAPSGPLCPECRSSMALRRTKVGPRRGHRFWGCRSYPHCRGTRAFSALRSR